MKRLLLLIGIFVFWLTVCLFAADSQTDTAEQKWSFPYNHEAGVLTGFAKTKLDSQGEYEIVPIAVRLGFNLDSLNLGFCDILSPLFKKMHVRPKGFTEIVLEAFVNPVVSPNANVEAGCTVLMKYSYPLTDKIYPFGIAGGGMAYLSQHTREQSMQWGFTPQIGAGVSFFLRENMALSVEYRHRHFSNANLRTPNDGINVEMVMAGAAWYY